MSGTLKIGGKTLATHDTSSNKLAFHSDANDTGQLCRAWVNFDGTLAMTVGSSYGPDAPPADYSSPNPIRAAYNVDYIIDRGTGDYEIHFENAMPDANYAVAGSASRPNGTSTHTPRIVCLSDATPISSTGARINVDFGAGTTGNDPFYVTVAIFR